MRTTQTFLSFLIQNKLLSEKQATEITDVERSESFSLYWEVRSLLYLGITFLSAGLGSLIYKNINSFGHSVLIVFIATLSLACFYYAFRQRKPFSWQEVTETTAWAGFALLGGCLAFLTLEGYLQYQYTFFGTRYGLAAFIPAVLFFFCAYRCDHRGVLSMSITALASGVGISIAPLQLWEANDFNHQNLTLTALLLGTFFVFIGWFSEQKTVKKHFSFTYFFMGGNLAFVSGLAALFTLDWKMVYFLFLAILSFLFVVHARKNHSYLFLLMGVIYGYISFTYQLFNLLPNAFDAMLYWLYFMLSGIGVIVFLVKIKELIGTKK